MLFSEFSSFRCFYGLYFIVNFVLYLSCIVFFLCFFSFIVVVFIQLIVKMASIFVLIFLVYFFFNLFRLQLPSRNLKADPKLLGTPGKISSIGYGQLASTVLETSSNLHTKSPCIYIHKVNVKEFARIYPLINGFSNVVTSIFPQVNSSRKSVPQQLTKFNKIKKRLCSIMMMRSQKMR